eukprot:444243_1
MRFDPFQCFFSLILPTMAAKSREFDGLLIESQDAHQQSSKSKNSCKKKNMIIIVAVSILILIIIIYIISAYVNNIWPFTESDKKINAGLIGEWPVHGGNIRGQQHSPINIEKEIMITNETIQNIGFLCKYETEGGIIFNGYITVKNDIGYFTDGSGYIRSVDLDTCNEIWRANINELLGYNNTIPIGTGFVSRNSVTLYQDSNGVESILFGAPNYGQNVGSDIFYDGCYVLSIELNTGKLLWKLNIANGLKGAGCLSHGFIVEDKYAFGGISSSAYTPFFGAGYIGEMFQGKMVKIDLDTHRIVNEWYAIDQSVAQQSDGNYTGCGIWNFPSIIGDYLTFGTGNLYTYPEHIGRCLNGSMNPLDTPIENNPIDPCGINQEQNYSFWRCLEHGVYPDSLIILNKNTFELIKAIPFQGVDAFNVACGSGLPFGGLIPPVICGPDSDIIRTANYIYNDTLHTSAMGKSGMFYSFQINENEDDIIKLHIARKIGPWGFNGGGHWSLAIDEQSHIGITSISGDEYMTSWAGPYKTYRYKMANNIEICDTGSIHAVDLQTGNVIWQLINPWGKINNIQNCSQDRFYENYTDLSIDTAGICQTDPNGMLNETVQNVIYPNISDYNNTLDQYLRAKFSGRVTISNNLVFIPSWSGDIFIVDLFTGKEIHRLQCIDHFDNIRNATNRYAISSGITIVKNRVLFYCGGSFVQSGHGNQFMSFKLDMF